MIYVKKINKLDNANKPMLQDVTFHIERGDFALIFGDDCDARMRLLNCIMGYEMYYSGNIRFAEDIGNVRYLPADVLYEEHITAGKYLLVNGRRFDNFNTALCGQLCDRLGIDVGERLVGMTYEDNKIVQLIAAVCSNPDLLIIDEAEQFISFEMMGKILNLLKKLNESGVTIMYSCDEYETLKGYCNRYIMINEGRVIADRYVEEPDIRKRVITIEGTKSETLTRVLGEYISTRYGRSSYVYDKPLERIPYILSKLKCKDYLVEEMTLAEELTGDYSRWKTL